MSKDCYDSGRKYKGTEKRDVEGFSKNAEESPHQRGMRKSISYLGGKYMSMVTTILSGLCKCGEKESEKELDRKLRKRFMDTLKEIEEEEKKEHEHFKKTGKFLPQK